MKGKLSIVSILICCVALLAGCNQKQDKGNLKTEIPGIIKNKVTEMYPNATILDFDKEQNGSEVDIRDKGIHKDVSFNANNEWVSTKYDIRAENVPVIVMDNLTNSAYNQYKIKEVDVIEKPEGLFYEFELKFENNEVQLIFDSEGQLVK